MEETCECPKCGMENAYFDGVSYYCPDCDHEWGEVETEEEDFDAYYVADDSEDY